METTVCVVHQAAPGVAQKLFDNSTEINACSESLFGQRAVSALTTAGGSWRDSGRPKS